MDIETCTHSIQPDFRKADDKCYDIYIYVLYIRVHVYVQTQMCTYILRTPAYIHTHIYVYKDIGVILFAGVAGCCSFPVGQHLGIQS